LVQKSVKKGILAPKTNAYHEIWLDDKLVAGHAIHDQEPAYLLAELTTL
jgi:hypothetical protein